MGTTDPCPSASNYQPAIKQYTATDTIAPSDMMFYTGNVFTAWRNNLFFVTLRTGRLYPLVLDGESVAWEEILIDTRSGPHPGHGRLRDIATGPDGLIYLCRHGANFATGSASSHSGQIAGAATIFPDGPRLY